jgi:peptide/nickel transport system permease protein
MQGKSASLSKLALQRFKKNFWGVFSFGFIISMVLLAIFAYVVAPDNSQNANQMALPIHSKSPGFKVEIITVPN